MVKFNLANLAASFTLHSAFCDYGKPKEPPLSRSEMPFVFGAKTWILRMPTLSISCPSFLLEKISLASQKREGRSEIVQVWFKMVCEHVAPLQGCVFWWAGVCAPVHLELL